MKRIFVIIAFFSFGLIANYRLDGFQVPKIYSHLKNQNHWEIQKLNNDQKALVDSILEQKFYYLSRGHQCFVFESEDQKYVLKLINHERFKLPEYLRMFIFLPSVKKLKNKRWKRLNPSFMSFRLAYEKLKNETGLIFLQLNKNNNFQKKIVLVDKTKMEHKVNLDKMAFMIQQKAEMIYPRLQKLSSEESEFRNALKSFAEIIKSRCEKCIMDDDLDVQINYGFIGNKAILIDPGRLFENKKLLDYETRKKELLKSTKIFRYWLKRAFPKHVVFFENILFNQDKESLQEAL